ncbi:class I adenylate-forming enzyme family protein [Actinomycetospora aeridis]|uniref:Class I adenylate-forming enzyme family protein n=1 Tax=Actinomycetospora aeridis TaxID=3129231 RepID=A0ABU8N6C9_9PSEU
MVGARERRLAELTAPGAAYELRDEVVDGVPLRVYARAPRSLAEVLAASRSFGDRDLLVHGDDRLTFAEHADLATALAGWLHHVAGVGRGDRVAVSMRNVPEWSPVFWATTALGAILVPLNAWWTAAEFRHALADCRPSLVIADPERVDVLLGVPELDVPVIEVRGTRGRGGGIVPWDEVVEQSRAVGPAPEVPIGPDDDATILYTAGTTGTPKGAVGSHRNFGTDVMNRSLAVVAGRGDAAPVPSRLLLTYPMFHIAGLCVLVSAVWAGTTVVTMHRWDPDEAVTLIRRERLTGAAGVPLTMGQLVDAVAPHRHELGHLGAIRMGGTAVPPELVRRIGARFDGAVAPTNAYGLTETTSGVVTTSGAEYLASPDVVGRPYPGLELAVVDPATGDRQPPGEVGEVWLRGANVVRRYWNAPAATAQAFTDGWFHTGDLGRVDDEGRLRVVDRIKDVVDRGGEAVHCVEVEDAIAEHPDVVEVAVIGVRHPDLGEEVGAIVRTRPGTALRADDLRSDLTARLAHFKIPTVVAFRDEPLPRNAVGKILKQPLRAGLRVP